MRKKRLILVSLLAPLLATLTVSLVPLNRTRVFGNLSSNDLGEISRVIHKDLRRFELPTLSPGNFHRPQYVVSSVKQYVARRILWVDVQDERTVQVYVGNSKDTIASDGWSYTLCKDPSWRIGRTAYWGSANRAPSDFKVPAGL